MCQVQFSVLYSAFQLSAILPFWPRVPEIGNIIKYLMIEIALLTKLSLIRIVQSKLFINHPRKWREMQLASLLVLCSAPSVPQPVVQSLGPSPG